MPPVLISILGGLVRWALGPLFTWMVLRGIISENQIVELVTWITLWLAGALWIVWKNVKAHRILNTALAASPGTTFAEVKQTVEKDGKWASALTPPNTPPVVKDNS